MNKKIYITKPMKIIELITDLEKGIINTSADFQRQYVWDNDNKKKIKLIESILLGLPIPPIYLFKNIDSTYDVIDGQQRLRTIEDFYNNKFKLTNIDPQIKINNNIQYSQLDQKNKNDFEEYELSFYIIETDNINIKYDIFDRLNRGSVKLNNQEIRNCIFRGKFNLLLKELSDDNNYRTISGISKNSQKNSIELRMKGQEYLLFYFSLVDGGLNYKSPLNKYLDNYMRGMIDLEKTKPEKVEEKNNNLKEMFNKSIKVLSNIYENDTVSIYILNKDNTIRKSQSLNVGLMTLLMYSFSQKDYSEEELLDNKDIIRELLIYLLTNNEDFIESLTTPGTNSTPKVKQKFNIWLTSFNHLMNKIKNKEDKFSLKFKSDYLKENNNICSKCKNLIMKVDDYVFNKENYWELSINELKNLDILHRTCYSENYKFNIVDKSNFNYFKDIKKNQEEDFSERIDRFEINIRKYIIKTFNDNNIENFWNYKHIPEDILSTANYSLEKDLKNNPGKEEEYKKIEHKINYLNIDAYIQILFKNEDLFLKNLDKNSIRTHLHNIKKVRNFLSHNNKSYSETDLEYCKGALKWFENNWFNT